VEVCVFTNDELESFIVSVWPKRHGKTSELMPWIKKARVAFPDVDLLMEARKAAVWEAEKISNNKKSAKRFLTNWWGRTQQRAIGETPVARVVSLSAVRWLSKNNKEPDYLFEKWARKRGVDETSVLSFCNYFDVSRPDSALEVVEVFLKGV
jgi:hypothetical protein